MARRDGAEVRKDRIKEITRKVLSLLQNHGKIPLSKTSALLEYETGLTHEKIMEYLKIAEAVGRFVIDVEKDEIREITDTPEEEGD